VCSIETLYNRGRPVEERWCRGRIPARHNSSMAVFVDHGVGFVACLVRNRTGILTRGVDCLLGVGGGRNQHVTSINNDVDHLAVALEMSVQMFISVRALASATARYRVRSPSG